MSTFDVTVPNNKPTNADPLVNVLKTVEMSARNSSRAPAITIAAAVLALPLSTVIGPFGPFVWLISMAVLFPLWLTAIHELGHLAVAWVAGFHIHGVVIGPVAVTRDGHSLRLKHNNSKALGGGVAFIPDDPDNQTGWLIAFSAAGAVANLVAGTFALIAFTTFPTTPKGELLLIVFIALSFVLGMMNLIPFRLGGFDSDGRTIVELLRGGPARDRLRASWRLSSLVLQKPRPRDWNPLTITAALTSADGSFTDASASYLAYMHHLDAGREDEAAQFIERSIASMGQVALLFSAPYYTEATYFHVRRDSNPVLAREILERIGAGSGDDISLVRTQAAVLLAEGQTERAAKTAQRAIMLADTWPDSGFVKAERELASRLLTIAESSEPPPIASNFESGHEGRVAITPVA